MSNELVERIRGRRMPGQRARREREAAARRRRAERAGHWERRFVTDDRTRFREEAEALRHQGFADEDIRIDMLCGRLTHPTTYVLSVFVADPGPDPDQGGGSGRA
ncbi:hypothetical protein ACWGCI_07925 [Streptomyces sp. NPDC054949]